MIIALEGIDAAGKNTQAKLLAEKLGNSVVFSFPDYSNTSGAMILDHLKSKWFCVDQAVARCSSKSTYDPYVFQSLMTINRLECLDKINKCNSTNDFVIFDRYTTSGLCYGSLDGVDQYWILDINNYLPKADLNILIDIDPALSIARRPDRRDRYEADQSLMRGARQMYLDLFSGKISFEGHYCGKDVKNHFDGNSGKNSCIIDGDGSIEDVNNRIMLAVYKYIHHRSTIREVFIQ